MNKLAFGYPPPENVQAAWGARLIITQQGMTDLVYNRQDAFGEWGNLKVWLNTGTPKFRIQQALGTLSEMLAGYQLSTRETKEVVLYEDDQGRIIGNPNSSAGYCYVCAWLFEDEAVAA
jgi:hypothetical protein